MPLESAHGAPRAPQCTVWEPLHYGNKQRDCAIGPNKLVKMHSLLKTILCLWPLKNVKKCR